MLTLKIDIFSFPPVKVQIQFIKHLLGVNRGAVNLAVFSELGVILISIDATKLSVSFLNIDFAQYVN